MEIILMLILGIAFIVYGIFLLGITFFKFKQLSKYDKCFISCLLVILIIGFVLTTFALTLVQIENYFKINIVW